MVVSKMRVSSILTVCLITAALCLGGLLGFPNPSDAKKKPGESWKPKTFDRSEWPHWIDSDGDGQDTRAEILIRDNIGELKFKRNKGKHVSWGKWVCPYTGKVILKASELDVDHVVPLAHAHFAGGWNWDKFRRRRFANDPTNLLAVDGETNRDKSAKSPHEWRPPVESFWPEYARIWRLVKKKYLLKIYPEEEKALREMEAWKPRPEPKPGG